MSGEVQKWLWSQTATSSVLTSRQTLFPSRACGMSSRSEENRRELCVRRVATRLGFAYRLSGNARYAKGKLERLRLHLSCLA